MTTAHNLPITWSYGGGVQSIGIAVLIAQGRLPVPECGVIADTEREIGSTWEYLDLYVQPLLAPLGLQIEIAPHCLSTVGLYGHNGDLLMPVYTETGKLSTYCSGEWKREVVLRYLRSKGYGPDNPVTTWMGFSMDEIARCNSGRTSWQNMDWPLIDLGDKYGTRMRRYQCEKLITDFGLPPAPKSRCYDCPHQTNSEWREVANRPIDWAAACATDHELTQYDISRGHSGVYLHKDRKPLAECDFSVPDGPQLELMGPSAECAAGSCWT